ncbi:hypothetical protein DFH07DRAFT_853381 [Mycena maculata]|uniref:Uncharacterized protein n=1 Tax=Mycena maculata TaxID=230809 RepID=A0AAD7HQM8_9AGAR|nr:hypothetical protein DFH07DRAFT_853381 [Mycena maculata]
MHGLVCVFLSLLYLHSFFSNALIISVPAGPILDGTTITVGWSATAGDPLSFTLALECNGAITLNDAVQRSSSSDISGQVSYLTGCLGTHLVEALPADGSQSLATSNSFQVVSSLPATTTTPPPQTTTTPPLPPQSTATTTTPQIQQTTTATTPTPDVPPTPTSSSSAALTSTRSSLPASGSGSSSSQVVTTPPSEAPTAELDQTTTSSTPIGSVISVSASPTAQTAATSNHQSLVVVSVSSVLGTIILLAILIVILWRVRRRPRPAQNPEPEFGKPLPFDARLDYAESGHGDTRFLDEPRRDQLTPQRFQQSHYGSSEVLLMTPIPAEAPNVRPPSYYRDESERSESSSIYHYGNRQ